MEIDSALRLDDLPLPDATRVRLLEAALRWVETQAQPTKALGQAAVDVTARLGGLEGPASRPVSAKTLERMLYAWRKAGRTWQALVDKRTLKSARCGVRTANRAFRAHLALLASRHPRSLVSAIKELYGEWQAGQAIPGYEGLNYQPGMPLPQGWSMDNLMRCMPDKRALAIAHKGVRAASAMLPQVFATRAGAWPCAEVQFDDVWLDMLAIGYDERGRLQLGRPLQLGCLDMYTGKRLCWGTKIRTKAEDGHSVQLNEDEMVCLLADFLFNVGYSRRGTVIVAEHGTAAISADVEHMLAALSDGLVRVDRSGMTGVRQPGAYGGRGVGNPRRKTELESWHNLLHNRMDDALTQTGKNRTEPEKLWGVRKEQLALLKAGGKMKAEDALLLSPLAPTLGELADTLARIVGGINARTDHHLEGWQDCGFMEFEFSLNGRDGWTRLEDLPPEMAPLAQAMARQNPALLRQRALSPQEAWERSVRKPGNELVRFTAAECVALMGAHRKFKLAARGGAFKLDSRSRHHEQLMFETVVEDADGNRRELPPGGTFFGVFNPFGTQLFVMDERDRVLGAAPLLHRFPHHDEVAKLREFGRVQARRAEELARVSNMLAPDTARHEVRRAYNKDVRVGQGVDPLARADQQRLSHMAAGRKTAASAPFVPPALPGGLGLADGYESSAFND